MKKVSYPLTSGWQNSDVVNLQDALRLMLERAAIMPDDRRERQRLLSGLASERANQVYGLSP